MAWFDFLNQANPKGQDAGSIARQRLNARAAIPIKPTVGLRGAGRFISPLFAIPDIIEQTQQVINPQDNIITRLGALGNSIENVIGSGGGAPKATKSSPGQQQQRPIGTQAVLNGKPVYWGGDDYGWQLLNGTGSSATLNSLNAPGTQGRFIQDTVPRSPGAAQGGGGGFSGAGSFAPIDPYAAQNREYERERARVEAMVKANPDMQKQAIANERAKVRDQGMAIWAAANPTLAKQVKPGAVGYDAIQRGIGIQELPSLEKRAEFTWNQATQGPTPAVPMADAMLNPAGPGFIGGEGAPPVNFADPRFENMSPEEFQKLLNQYTKR
jgi:hypothetical protein